MNSHKHTDKHMHTHTHTHAHKHKHIHTRTVIVNGANFRYSKPFNPLLAETYELVREDKGYACIAEQVPLLSSLI